MPRVPEQILECAFFMYEGPEAARTGDAAGGTGFFVGMKSKKVKGLGFTYAITNRHVVTKGFSTLRLNLREGGTEIVETDPADWHFRHKGDDLAVLPIGVPPKVKYRCIGEEMFITEKIVTKDKIGPGDDVFMVGRFVNHDGGSAANSPALRFGHISVDPKILDDDQDGTSLSYVLDIHSRSGFSGSPVFVYRTAGSDLLPAVEGGIVNLTQLFLRLLAVHYSQFPEEWDLETRKERRESSTLPIIKGQERNVVVGMSGMTCAIPAWRLLDLLNIPELVQKRTAEEARHLSRLT